MALNLKMQERPQSIADFQDALSGAQKVHGVASSQGPMSSTRGASTPIPSEPTPQPPRRNRSVGLKWAAAVLIVIAGGIGGYFAYDHFEDERQRVQALADAEKARAVRLAREAEEAKRKAEMERKRAEEARRRTEGRIKVLVGLPGREQTRLLKPGAGKTEWFKDCATCPEMVVVPAGAFMMGSPKSEAGRDGDEGPQHRVRIGTPFAVGRFEVTFSEWDACIAAGGCKHTPGDQGWGRGRQPVINVSWDDAKAYVAWLSKTTGKTYRLLSEAEWENAARAGTTTPFWWCASISTDKANYDGNYTYGGSSKGQYRQRTVKVDSFKPNPWGLYQVHGNVWEWVADCWNNSYAGAPGDGSPRTSGVCTLRVLRGGSWLDNPNYLRSADRVRDRTRGWVINHGFRVARTL